MTERWSQASDGLVLSEYRRRVFEPETGDERLAALRLVFSSREPARIDGVFVEYHWARMMPELYAELDVEARRQLTGTRIPSVPDLIREWAKRQTTETPDTEGAS